MQTATKKKTKHDHNFQEFWVMIKRPNLRINGVDEGSEIQTKGKENVFNEIAENFSTLEKKIWTSKYRHN
jgi:hypothetical protein